MVICLHLTYHYHFSENCEVLYICYNPRTYLVQVTVGCGSPEALHTNMALPPMVAVAVSSGYSVIVGFALANIEEMRINTKSKLTGIYWEIIKSFLYKEFCKIFK